ncbi:MAG: family 78 glycoside hydrolase catalytic domain [Chitinophagaceae bacterium]
MQNIKRLFFIVGLLSGCIALHAQLLVTNLRCGYRSNPLGIGTPKPMFSWELTSTDNKVLQTSYRILVADDSIRLANNVGNVWDSQQQTDGNSIQVAYNGNALAPAKKYYWKLMTWDNKGNQSAWSAIAFFSTGLFSKSDWKNARWIAYDVLPDTSIIVPFAHGNGKKTWGPRKDILPMLRKSFTISKPVKNAMAYICGLGQFEMSINGEKTGDHFLDPGWTQYSKHALYVSFDISSQLKQGDNAVGVMLGNGFYYIPGQRYRKLTGAFGYPKMFCRIAIEYTDGSVENIVSDASWKTAPSPYIFSSIYGGEDYDAGLEQPNWNKPGFNESNWKNVVITTGPESLEAQDATPLKIMQSFAPVKQTMLKPGVWVYDLGQNFSGIPRISVAGKRGDTVRIIPAELINEDGSANQKASGSPCYYTYVLKGGETESWQPSFSFYGFRYLQVEGAVPAGEANTASMPEVKYISGMHTRNSADSAGSFSSSNTLFNQTDQLIKWAIKSNTHSVFTDCPHREKLGWLEETHLVGSSVQYNLDIAALCQKVIKDMMEAQTPEGLIPEIAPEFVEFTEPFRDSPEWGSAAIILPWYNYQWYGDATTLSAAYGMMRRYVEYLKSKAKGNILSQGLGDWYDIGPAHPGVSQLTPQGVTATAIYYYDLTIMSQVAALLHNDSDKKMYNDLSVAVKDSFNARFYDKTNKYYASGSQAANAMALFMNLVTKENRNDVIESLVKDIRNRNNALTAGDIGYRYVLRALEDAGRSEVIFDMNSRNDVPGYGYQLAHGATALTESWQAYPSVSNNHFMLGHLMEWFYAGLCGIRQPKDGVGFKEIEIRPQPVGNVTQAAANFHSPYGWIRSAWQRKDDMFMLQVSVPANTKAKIYLPGKRRAKKVGSGDYIFSVKMKTIGE